MESTASAREARALERRTWPVRSHALGAEPSANLRVSTTPAERLAMMWELARQSWTLSGRPIPQYDRGESPGRVVRFDA